MKASMLVMTLMTENGADRADMENLFSHRREGGAMARENVRVAADDDRDVSRGGEMHAAGDGCFQRRHATLRGESGEAQDRVLVVGAHLDPGRARLRAREHAIGAGQHALGDGGRRQTGDDRVDLRGDVRAASPPIRRRRRAATGPSAGLTSLTTRSKPPRT